MISFLYQKEIIMSEEVKEVEMFAYFANGKELWTSNFIFAQIRASYYGTDKVYVEKTVVE
jgi:hypothetical protein